MRVPSDLFTVQVEHSNGTARLRLTGRFDAAAVDTLDALIGVVRDRDVVMDLEGITFMDSAGWLGVMAYERRVHDWGKDVRLQNVPEHVRRIFELTATEHLFSEAVGL
ncbi:MAG TPA: STAS domain-containing protein [Actinomycetota bacterium]|nr:STAS domain-containing protein [Actinomycetota bacterium]